MSKAELYDFKGVQCIIESCPGPEKIRIMNWNGAKKIISRSEFYESAVLLRMITYPRSRT